MKIKNNDLVYIIFDKRRKYIRKVESGKTFHTDRGFIKFDDIIGKEFGETVCTQPSNQKAYLLRPIPKDIITKMGRASQIIYPEDIGMILMYTGISPGYLVVEAGCGSGSLTSIMGVYVQPSGHIFSYDIREKAVKQARKNMKKMGVEDFVSIEQGDICDPEMVQKHSGNIDAVILDMVTPWMAIPNTFKFLKNSGICCIFSPVIEQVKKTREVMEQIGFYELETYELLKRKIQVKSKGYGATRPESRMVGHTGYLTFGRKVKDNFKDLITKEEYLVKIRNSSDKDEEDVIQNISGIFKPP